MQELYEECRSYINLSNGEISCQCLKRCTSDNDCQPELDNHSTEKTEQCVNGFCVAFSPCGLSHPSGPGCGGSCPAGQECLPNDTNTVCECQGKPCDKTSPLVCGGGVCEPGQACISSINSRGNPSCQCIHTCTSDRDCRESEWCSNTTGLSICVPRQPCGMITTLQCEGGSCPEGQYCANREGGTTPCQCAPRPVCSETNTFRCEAGTCTGTEVCVSKADEFGFLSCSCEPRRQAERNKADINSEIIVPAK